MIPVLRATIDPTRSTAAAAPLLVLGPSLGTTAETWADAAQHLSSRYRVLRFDLPGHGASPAATTPFSMTELAAAVVDLVDSQGGGRFSYAGVSLGGAIGLEVALGPAGDRLDALVLLCSGARIGAPDDWTARALQVRQQGTASMVAGSSRRWFAPSFPSRDPDRVGRALNDLLDIDDGSYAACCEALAGFDRTADLDRVHLHVEVVVGDADPVVTAADGQRLVDRLPDAALHELPDTGHQAQLERPAEVAALIGPAREERYDAGMRVRRAVLSDPYVDASSAAVTPETSDFQRFITEYAWGSVWTRPGLERRLRSAVTISSLVTGHHWHELELHLHAGLRNGLTRAELSEILLQTAVYAGVPAANSAFGVLQRVLAEQDGKDT